MRLNVLFLSAAGLALASISGLSAFSRVPAPQMKLPLSEHQKWLEGFVGYWDVGRKMISATSMGATSTWRMPPGTETNRMVGGWLVSKSETTSVLTGEVLQTIELTAYDPEKKMYIRYSFDGRPASVSVTEGTLNGETGVLTFWSEPGSFRRKQQLMLNGDDGYFLTAINWEADGNVHSESVFKYTRR